jgi:predicted nucleotidyltransferase component of viral defense system
MEAIQNYAREKNINEVEALQMFFQVLVLKHLSAPGVHFMGGTALVLGYGNPRFSEDIDLTQVKDPMLLSKGLEKSAKEASQWLETKVRLQHPKQGKGTWKMICALTPSRSVRLHIDTQRYSAQTTHPIVIQFPLIPSFVCEALSLQEILAEKTLALAFRKYLGGRDLFDLWFHWLRKSDWDAQENEIFHLVKLKLKERSVSFLQFQKNLRNRLREDVILHRARAEWQRYLPPNFQKESIFRDIVSSRQKLKKWTEK